LTCGREQCVWGGFFGYPLLLYRNMLLDRLSISTPFWLITLFYIAALGLIYQYRERLPHKEHRAFHFFHEIHSIIRLFEVKHLRTLYLTLFFWFTGLTITLQWALPIANERFYVSEMKMLYGFIMWSLVWACSGLLFRWCSAQISFWQFNLWALFFHGLLLFFTGISEFFTYFILIFITTAIFASFVWSNTMSLISLSAREELQGSGIGLVQASLGCAQLSAPILGGIIAGFSLDAVFYLSSLLVLISFLFLLTLIVRKTHLRFI